MLVFAGKALEGRTTLTRRRLHVAQPWWLFSWLRREGMAQQYKHRRSEDLAPCLAEWGGRREVHFESDGQRCRNKQQDSE